MVIKTSFVYGPYIKTQAEQRAYAKKSVYKGKCLNRSEYRNKSMYQKGSLKTLELEEGMSAIDASVLRHFVVIIFKWTLDTVKTRHFYAFFLLLRTKKNSFAGRYRPAFSRL